MGGSDSTLFCRSLDCHKSRTGGGCHRAAQYTPFILPLTAAACSAICPRLYGIAAGLAVLVLFYCASLCNMSIGTGVVVAVAFQQVDRAPDTETGTESHNESLQYTDCCVKKCHTFSSFARFRSFIYG